MVYLEYDDITKQVIEIHESLPSTTMYAVSPYFNLGDEFELTIWINEVDENKNVLSHTAIRNNPNAQRLLRENAELKQENAFLKAQKQALSEQVDFHEELIVELAMQVYA